MPQAAKPTDRCRPPAERVAAGDEPARFLRNLTSLPDAEFASTYSPAIHRVLERYADCPDPAAARRELLLSLKAALKRRRAFILPRFTQAEDSWRIRECATYAVAVVVLVEHAAATLDPNRTDPPTESGAWTGILAEPEAEPDAGTPLSRIALFHAIVPARGRRWIAGEPLVRTLLANHFADTAPNELHDIVGPVIAGFGQAPQGVPAPSRHDTLQNSPAPVPSRPPEPPTPKRPLTVRRSLAWVRAAFGRRSRPRIASTPPSKPEPDLANATIAANHLPHGESASPEPVPTALCANANRLHSPEAPVRSPRCGRSATVSRRSVRTSPHAVPRHPDPNPSPIQLAPTTPERPAGRQPARWPSLRTDLHRGRHARRNSHSAFSTKARHRRPRRRRPTDRPRDRLRAAPRGRERPAADPAGQVPRPSGAGTGRAPGAA